MVNRWFGVGQFLSGAMGQLYPGGDKPDKYVILPTYFALLYSCCKSKRLSKLEVLKAFILLEPSIRIELTTSSLP